MSKTTLQNRSDIDAKYLWNSPSLYPSDEAWQADLKTVIADLAGADKFRGHLADSPQVLADFYDYSEDLNRRLGKLMVYALMSFMVDTNNQTAAATWGQLQGAFGQVVSAISFMDPELIALGEPTIKSWLESESRLKVLSHYVNDLFRQQAHVRSAEIEELLGSLVASFAGANNTYDTLTNADIKFKPAKDSQGEALTLTVGTMMSFWRVRIVKCAGVPTTITRTNTWRCRTPWPRP